LHFLHGITVAGVVNGGWTPIWRKILTVACQPHPTAAQLSSLERRALEAIKLHLSLRLDDVTNCTKNSGHSFTAERPLHVTLIVFLASLTAPLSFSA